MTDCFCGALVDLQRGWVAIHELKYFYWWMDDAISPKHVSIGPIALIERSLLVWRPAKLPVGDKYRCQKYLGLKIFSFFDISSA